MRHIQYKKYEKKYSFVQDWCGILFSYALLKPSNMC